MRLSHTLWTPDTPSAPPLAADLVFAFGPRSIMQRSDAFAAVATRHPGALVVGASTGGQIAGGGVSDGVLATTAVTFDSSGVAVVNAPAGPGFDGDRVGARLAEQIAPSDGEGRALRYVFVLADGIEVNGSALAEGLESRLPDGVTVTGGLAGDDDRFEKTVLWAGGVLDGPQALAVAFYGERLHVGVAAGGGWDTFGIERRVTASRGNVVAEFDGQPALDLYERYLGDYAAALPASGLRFPLSVRYPEAEHSLVRTLLGIDRDARTLTFAGDVPEGARARLMRSNPDRLVDGAQQAASAASAALGVPAQLALLVSCVGRKWAMGERIEEEVEDATLALGAGVTLGFYSYGELAPAANGNRCALHNQTMTVTAFAEV